MKLPKLTAVIEPGEDGWYIANCPELGIVSQGETPEQAEAMIKEAVELWLECAEESEVRQRIRERKVAIKELEVPNWHPNFACGSCGFDIAICDIKEPVTAGAANCLTSSPSTARSWQPMFSTAGGPCR